MSNLPFTHLRVELRGLMVAGKVWNAGDLVPLDGSTPEAVHPLVLAQAGKLEHPHLTPGRVRGDGAFVPLDEAVEVESEAAEAGSETQTAGGGSKAARK